MNSKYVLRMMLSRPVGNFVVEHRSCLKEKEGTLCVENPHSLITDDILSLLHDSSKVNREEMMRVVTSPELTVCKVTDINPDGEPVTVEISKKICSGGTLYFRVDYKTLPRIEYAVAYCIAEIPVDRAVYLVLEEFNPFLIERRFSCVHRFYHDFFISYADAEKYRSGMKTHDDFAKSERHLAMPVAEIMVFDRDEIEKSGWYGINRKVMDLMAEKGVDEFDSSFRVHCNQHIECLEKSAGKEN